MSQKYGQRERLMAWDEVEWARWMRAMEKHDLDEESEV
jgi:hypothetical protein